MLFSTWVCKYLFKCGLHTLTWNSWPTSPHWTSLSPCLVSDSVLRRGPWECGPRVPWEGGHLLSLLQMKWNRSSAGTSCLYTLVTSTLQAHVGSAGVQPQIGIWRVQDTLDAEGLKTLLGFPGGAVVENLPANAGDTGSSPGLGRSHMPRSNWAREPRLLSLRVWSLCSAMRGRDSERPAHHNEGGPPLAATRESPRTETKTQHSQK